jgi:hypothetical protein
MDWDGSDRLVSARGKTDTYLVFGDEREVRLTRHRSVVYVNRAYEAARNVIVFPLGRGPGRPAGEPELTALMGVARLYAERYEAGESLDGYPQWQHAEATAKPSTSVYRDEPSAVRRFLDADQLDHLMDLVGVDGHTERGHSTSGPSSCRRCELLRANQGWVGLV